MRLIVTGILMVILAVMVPPASSQVDFLFRHGFAAGDVTPASAVLWTRRPPPLEVTAQVSSDPQFRSLVFSAEAAPSAERGGFLKFTATGLRPATRYYYRFQVAGSVSSETGTFVTAPAPESRADVRLAFSGDIDSTNWSKGSPYSFGLLETLAAEPLDLFLLIGDTIYADSGLASQPARTLAEYRAKHLEARGLPSLQRLMRRTPLIVIWDDHEVQNDFDRETVDPARFAAGHQAFLEAWPIAQQPDGRLYRTLRYGREVEIFVLDLRSYRTRQVNKTPACMNPPGSRRPDLAPTLPQSLRSFFAVVTSSLAQPASAACLRALADPGRTMLGAVQKTWLKERLQRSDATWKVIVSEVPVQEFFAFPYDRWEGYAAERAELLRFIRGAGITNVVWLSADMHAVLVNDVRLSTFPAPDPTGMKEVVAGPIATAPFGRELDLFFGSGLAPAFGAFLTSPLPQGVGAACAVLDRPTYALLEVSSASGTLTITAKDTAARPVCRTPLTLRAGR
ncbi:MAG TPA: alkaline phosphatase D family protein [bacterium]|nr:alkaline phosphatase D family protein [bacterium]